MVNYSTWMQQLDDNTKLTKLSIPGTHNSAACHTALPSVQCQGETVTEQLKNGVRFLDIRAGKLFLKEGDEAKDLQVIHGKFPVRIPFARKLTDVLQEVYDFLDEHRSEVVIVSLKQEGSNDWNNDQDEFGNLIWDKYVNPNKNKWYLGTDIPRLGDARGKAVLFRRFGVKNEQRKNEFGFEASYWSYNTTDEDRGSLVVQDFCEVSTAEDISKKIEYVKEMNKKATDYCRNSDDKLFVNFTSAASFFDHDCWPQQVSTAIIESKVQDGFARGSGVIVLDYIETNNWELARKLVDSNF